MKTAFFTALTLAGLHASAQAQTPLVDFKATTYTTGNATWTDSQAGILATASGTPTRSGSAINTSTGSFTFNTGSVTGLSGLTSYTLAIGFTANSIPAGFGGANFYQGSGVFGADIPGAGQGDSGVALTTDGGGQIVAGLGTANNGDQNLYDTSGSTFALNKPLGLVLVVNGSGGAGGGTVQLYINGALTTQPGALTGETIQPFGSNNGTVGGFSYGIGVVGNNGNNTLQGSVSEAEIFGSALTPAQAMSLSGTLAVVPEPSAWALVAGGLGLALAGRRLARGKAAV